MRLKFRSKHSTILLLCLLQNLRKQTLCYKPHLLYRTVSINFKPNFSTYFHVIEKVIFGSWYRRSLHLSHFET